MADPQIETLETALRQLQAQQLARGGRLREAMAVLAPGGVPPADNTSLQAYAALATGAGDLRLALPLWRTLLERDPSHREARRMIHAIELWQRRPGWMRWFWPAAACLGAAVLVGVLLAVV